MSSEYDRYAPIPAWQGVQTRDLVLPSKQVCLVRDLQVEDVAELDIIDVMDIFSNIVGKGKAAPSAKAKTKTAAQSADKEAEAVATNLFRDAATFMKVVTVTNKVITRAVIKPEILLPPDNYEDRIDGKIYADSIPFGDRMFIFTEVFKGMSDLESFREESAEGVGDVEAKPIVQLPPVAAPGHKVKP